MRNKRFILTQSVLFSAVILMLLFLFGGIIQLAGVLSITKTNFAIFLLIFFFVLLSSKSLYLNGGKQYILPLSYLGLYIIINAYITHTVSNCVFYLYILVVLPFTGVIFSEKMLGKNGNSFNFARLFFYVLAILQIPFLLIQNIFSDAIGSFLVKTRLNISFVDLHVGSFFIKSDYTLTLFMNVLLINILWHLKVKKAVRFTLALLIFSAIFMTNSNMGLINFTIIIIAFWISKVKHFNKMITASLIAVTAGTITIVILCIDFQTLFNDLLLEVERIEYIALKGEMIPRYSGLLMLLSKKINLWGYGLMDYYNYFSLQWKFYAGHSLWLTVYNDIGLVGVGLTLWVLWSMVHKDNNRSTEGYCLFFVMVSYSFVSVLLSDLGAMVILFFFMQTFPRMLEQNQLMQIHQQEYETYLV